MHVTPDPLADWRMFVYEADLSLEVTEIAMAIADHAIGKRNPLALIGPLGWDRHQFLDAVQVMIDSRLLDYDDEKAIAKISILFAEENTPPGVEGDFVFDGAAYRSRHGDWEEEPHGTRRRADETLLYHYYDAQDVLLYIGITNSLPRRQASHEGRSTWMDFATRSTMKRFPTRASAEVVEAASIRHRAPLFNVEHNDRPDRVRRIVDYLIDRDRRDLLVPLISRG
jgi:hypothetical protein